MLLLLCLMVMQYPGKKLSHPGTAVEKNPENVQILSEQVSEAGFFTGTNSYYQVNK